MKVHIKSLLFISASYDRQFVLGQGHEALMNILLFKHMVYNEGVLMLYCSTWWSGVYVI